MKKRILMVIFSVVALFCALSLFACSGGNSENLPVKDGITFNTLQVTDNEVYGKVSNNTATFNFLTEVKQNGKAKYTVSFDRNGNNKIESKNVDLSVGDNVYYITVTVDGEMINFYTVTIRRRPIYTVTFNTDGGTKVNNQQVEEDSFAIEPTTTRAGYTFNGWNYDFSNAIVKDTTIKAIWTANTDTPYKVEYYLENLYDDNYTLQEDDTQNLTGTTDTVVTANKTYEHFNAVESTASANINGDGSTVLKVYYNLERYTIKIIAQDNATVDKSYNGSYKYGYPIEQVTATFNNYLGYKWGWYSNGVFLSDDNIIPAFTVEKNTNYVAKVAIKEEMSIFNFTSNENTCNITGLKNKNLTEIMIPDYVTSIGYGAFSGCSSLTSVTIGNSVTSIENYAFYECRNLTRIIIPDSVTNIGNYAFEYCYSLTSIEIPDSVTSIGVGAFFKCNKLTNVTIGNSVTSIGSSAFSICSSLTSIEIPDSVTSIGEKAFYKCYSLTSVIIGNSVKSMGDGAFEYCGGLTSVIIGNSVKSIGKEAFSECTSLTSIYYTGTPSQWAQIDGLYYLMSSGRTLYINNEPVTEITLEGITEIKGYAFSYCSSLTSVTIGNSVTSIGDRAFSGCSSLTSVTFKNTNGWNRSMHNTTIIISSGMLSNTHNAANYLQTYSNGFCWWRK